MGIKELQNTEPSQKATETSWTESNVEEIGTYENLAQRFVEYENNFRDLFLKTAVDMELIETVDDLSNIKMKTLVKLLTLKKQLILQGPPGTGKTRLAKELAAQTIGITTTKSESEYLTDEQIVKALDGVTTLSTVAGRVEYQLIKVDADNKTVVLRKSTETEATTTFDKIKQVYKDRQWDREHDNNPDRRAAAVAKFITEHPPLNPDITQKEQYRLIQFHPAYSYEDFVRGIVAKPNEGGEGIIYTAENKLLADLAKSAHQNYLESRRHDSDATINRLFIEQMFEDFIGEIEKELIQNNHKIPLTATLNITKIKENAFHIESAGWSGDDLKFSQIKKLYEYGVTQKSQLSQHPDIAKTVYHRTPYYFPVVEMFRKYLTKQPSPKLSTTSLKNYVLIIDEINRANLPAVFGELIYALEYRGQTVSSIYDIDGDASLVLPPNLYIIGTMNTADRSVGHIDFALRRRFAFKSVLPNPSPVHNAAKPLFEMVSQLFVGNYATIDWSAEHPKLEPSAYLAPDFKPEDVWIGHSYFIAQDTEEHTAIEQLNLKRTFELVPLLHEYLKDGVLLPDAKSVIDEISTLPIQ